MTQAHIDVYVRRERSSEALSARGGRVERRAAVLPGFVYFLSIHTRPTVVRGPAGEVYMDVAEATGLSCSSILELGGKGLKGPFS